MRNPFTAGSLIQKADDFYNRTQLIQQLANPSSLAFFLRGNRRMGKTSVLRYVERLLKNDQFCMPVYVSIQGCQTVEAMGKDLLRAVKKCCTKLKINGFHFEGEMDLVEVIEQWLDFSETLGYQCVLLVDEAEELLNLSDPYLEKLRKTLLDEDDNLKVIITATSRLWELYNRKSNASTFLNGFMHLYIGPLTSQDGENLITQTQNRDVKVTASPETIDAIVKLTGGHPFLIQKLCSELFENGRLRDITPKDLVLDKLLMSTFKIDFKGVGLLEQKILTHLYWEQGQSLATLKHQTQIPAGDLSSCLLELENLGFILEENGLYRLRNYFFAQWIAAKQPARVFISYSHKDATWKEELLTQMAPLIDTQKILVWDDTQIQPGARWENEIEAHLQLSRVFLFLISPDMLSSSFVMKHELPAALAKEKDGSGIVIPVIVRPCQWEITAFSQFQALTKDGKPLSLEVSKDKALYNAVKRLSNWLDEGY